MKTTLDVGNHHLPPFHHPHPPFQLVKLPFQLLPLQFRPFQLFQLRPFQLRPLQFRPPQRWPLHVPRFQFWPPRVPIPLRVNTCPPKTGIEPKWRPPLNPLETLPPPPWPRPPPEPPLPWPQSPPKAGDPSKESETIERTTAIGINDLFILMPFLFIFGVHVLKGLPILGFLKVNCACCKLQSISAAIEGSLPKKTARWQARFRPRKVNNLDCRRAADEKLTAFLQLEAAIRLSQMR